jgi:hypothetical protein
MSLPSNANPVSELIPVEQTVHFAHGPVCTKER